MKQTRKASLVEALLGTALGFAVAMLTQVVVFPWFGIYVPIATDIALSCIFTIISIIRGFALRRMFEHLRVRGILR